MSVKFSQAFKFAGLGSIMIRLEGPLNFNLRVGPMGAFTNYKNLFIIRFIVLVHSLMYLM